ncbi:hypothetical protein [Inquilinus limosus]|uniref:hypothetical protein n=1 Tax=Inquilinus limosus TaxID=171674 RepID=UPI0012DC3DB5|nr:hypothetical protein [Inquilinus limosus]
MNDHHLECSIHRGSPVARIKHYAGVIHYATGAYPSLFFPLHRLLGEVDTGPAVTRDTDLVIEGFPRSGNTFAVCAFKLAQPGPVKIADHIHVAAQIIRAARYHVPACILARRPEDAVRSLVVKYPFLNPRHVLQGYAGFYEKCLPYRRHFVAATFDDVTTDFGAVIDRINRRFGTCFHRFEACEENVRRVFQSIDERNAHEPIDPTFGSARPNSIKELAKQSIRLREDDSALVRCRAVFEVYRLLARDVDSPLVDSRARELRVRNWRFVP